MVELTASGDADQVEARAGGRPPFDAFSAADYRALVATWSHRGPFR